MLVKIFVIFFFTKHIIRAYPKTCNTVRPDPDVERGNIQDACTRMTVDDP